MPGWHAVKGENHEAHSYRRYRTDGSQVVQKLTAAGHEAVPAALPTGVALISGKHDASDSWGDPKHWILLDDPLEVAQWRPAVDRKEWGAPARSTRTRSCAAPKTTSTHRNSDTSPSSPTRDQTLAAKRRTGADRNIPVNGCWGDSAWTCLVPAVT
jgi:hypothetical protein